MTATLLVVGAGREQLPAYRMARRLGLRVLASDRDPHAPGVALADGFAPISTHDLAGNLAFARAQGIDGVMTLCSETAVPVVAGIAARLNLPGIGDETARRATNKNAMRAALKAAGVRAPPSREVADLEDARDFIAEHGLPVVIKPSDGSGQKATVLLQDTEQLAPRVAEALALGGDGRAIIEGFVPGLEINVTAVVREGEPCFTSFSDRITAPLPHFGIALRHVSPPDLTPAGLAEVEAVARRAIQAIGLREGIAYPQILFDGTRAWLIEIAARIPGGFMAEVALYRSGIDLVEVAILQALGRPCELAALRRLEPRPALVVDFITRLDVPGALERLGRVSGLEAAAQCPGVEQVFFGLSPGDPVPDLTHSGARFGAVLASGAHRQDAWARAAQAKTLIHIE